MNSLFPHKPNARPCSGKSRGFSLAELLVVISIMITAAAVGTPIMRSATQSVRMSGATERLKAALQQTRTWVASQPLADRGQTAPLIANSVYAGVALVVRWDAASGDYEVFYAVHNQGAVDVTDTYLSALATPKKGYSRLTAGEPMTLPTGIRVAAVRRKIGAKDKRGNAIELELVPDPANPALACDSFAVCVDVNGLFLPSAQQIVVNLQEPPPMATAAPGPWAQWDTAAYSAATGTGELFATGLPILILYQEQDAQSLFDAAGRLPQALDPNELLSVARGRLVMVSTQGGMPVDF